MITKKTFQQGDVIGKKIQSLPLGKKEIISKKRMILAEGEVTGHYHGIEEEDSELIKIGDQILLNLAKNATLTHQEHGPIELEAGIWDIGRVQEFDYFSMMKRQVVD
jgi:hypothetical protein